MRLPLMPAGVVVLAALLLAGCAARDDWAGPHPTPSAVGALRRGFEPASPPSPEATISPSPGSWSDVHPSDGYRVVLLTGGTGRETRVVAAAVRRWARDDGVDLREIAAGDDAVAAIESAMALRPDLVVSAGNRLVDPLATVTASNLHQQFLVVGAEVAEPTANVTAVDWTGASYRGEGLGTPSRYDPATFTAARCDAAVRAGTAAVLHGLTGIVVWID